MKKQIITLIIGILIGAVVTAAIFLIFKPKESKKGPDFGSNGERQFPGNKEDLPEGFELPEGMERPNGKFKDREKSNNESSNETEE